MIRLSALHTDRLYLPEDTPGTHFWHTLSRPHGRSAAGRIKTTKNSMAVSVIEPATFRFVAQCLNLLRYRAPPLKVMGFWKKESVYEREKCRRMEDGTKRWRLKVSSEMFRMWVVESRRLWRIWTRTVVSMALNPPRTLITLPAYQGWDSNGASR